MNVLYISKALVTATYRDKLSALSEHAHVRAVTPERWGSQAMERGGDVRIESARALLHGSNHFHVYRHAGRLLGGERPDIVHIDEEPYSAVTWQLARTCRRLRVPAVFFAWQNLDKRLPPPFGAMRNGVFRATDGAIAGTEDAAAVLRAAGFDKPVAVIPQFGVDPRRFAFDERARARIRSLIGVAPDAYVVGYGGRLLREKGVHQLIEAAERVREAHMVIVGDGPERGALERRALAGEAAGRVLFAGPVPSADMPAWISAFDVLALPSMHTTGWVEQFGRILIEAMACGIPVVGSTSGEIPRVIGRAGVVVAEGDAAALAGALERLRDPARRASLGALGRARVLERFTQERVARETFAFYERILGDGLAP